MIRELFPMVLVATVLGIMNTFDSVCEALFEPLVGALLDLTWTGEIVNDIHQFSLSSYQWALLLLPLSLLLALIMLMFIKETHCRAFEDAH